MNEVPEEDIQPARESIVWMARRIAFQPMSRNFQLISLSAFGHVSTQPVLRVDGALTPKVAPPAECRC